jgi:excisionase family DNA binding protein
MLPIHHDSPILVSYQRAADLLGVHLNTVKNLVAEQALPVVRVRGRCLIALGALHEYIARNTVSRKAIEAFVAATELPK